jgi:hypothetical protein
MNIQQAKDIVKAVIQYNIDAKASGTSPSKLMNPQLVGDPGIGKTTAPQQAAEELGLEFRSVIVAQYDAGELGGMPYLDEEGGEKAYRRARPDWLPMEGKGILLCDELSQAPMANLNIMAQLANEHRVGEHRLGEGWTLVFANNAMSNRAGTNNLPTHLKDRLMPLEVSANIEDSLNYFNVIKASDKLVSFLRSFPQRLAEFDTKKDVCPSPRSYERVNTLLDMLDKKTLTRQAFDQCLSATIGSGAANDFITHLSLHAKMVDPMDVVANPETAELPEDVNVSYVAVAALASISNESNIGAILTYADRLTHQDHVAFLIKDALTRSGGKKSPLLKTPEVKKYLQTNAKELVL